MRNIAFGTEQTMQGTGTLKKTRLFALILIQHRIWGMILMPYIIQREPGRSYHRLAECLSPFPASETMGTLAPEERDLVNIINEYNERALFKLFSKDRSVKEFLANITEDKLERHIRPYIERRLFKCFQISREENIPVYFQKTKSAAIHSEDMLRLYEENAEPVFIFSRDNEQSTYKLTLEAGGRPVKMKQGSTDIICVSPCVIRDGNGILFVSDIEGSKLKPFISREFIQIPKKTEVKYFGSFVLNAINNYRVSGSGFKIIEYSPPREALLSLETVISGDPMLILQFDYDGNKVYHGDQQMAFTQLESTGGQFVFRKFYRDMEWERNFIERLEQLGYYSDDNVNFTIDSPGNRDSDRLYSVVESVNRNFPEITDAGFILRSRLTENFNLYPVGLELSSRLENDWFDLRAVVKIGEWEFPFTRLRKNILSGIRVYELPDGSKAVLPETWFARYKNLFEFGKSKDDSLRIHKQHFSLLADSISDEGNQLLEKLERLLIPENLAIPDTPSGLRCEMRHYQSEGLAWLHFLQTAGLGGCLADDMGLGKTIQALALLQHNKENINTGQDQAGELTLFGRERKRLTSLVIVPASLIYNWQNEIKRFVPGMVSYSYQGNQRKKSPEWFTNFDIILSSYHTVRQDIDIISSFNFHYIILDESQTIKNPGSALYRTMIKLRSDYKLVLTGTPVENSLTDLWSQLNFVNPGLLGDLSFFRREFARPIEKSGDDQQEDKLRKIIRPFILRRTKEMVAGDLPPVTEQTVFCDMTEEQSRLYEEEKSAVRNSIFRSIETSGLEKSAIVVLQGLMKLRQLANHPVMTLDDYVSGSGKFETVLQDMENVISEKHKILVFSSFVKHLNLYAAELTGKRIPFSMLTGATVNRERVVNAFQDDPGNRIFLISLKAGGVGLNLTAADYVFILDPWWNPATEMQAMNRAHRIGQDKNVFMYKYITTNTIEEKIIRLQEKKSRLAETFINSNNPLKDLDLKQILDIID